LNLFEAKVVWALQFIALILLNFNSLHGK